MCNTMVRVQSADLAADWKPFQNRVSLLGHQRPSRLNGYQYSFTAALLLINLGILLLDRARC